MIISPATGYIRCYECGNVLPISDASKDSGSPHGVRSRCRWCEIARPRSIGRRGGYKGGCFAPKPIRVRLLEHQGWADPVTGNPLTLQTAQADHLHLGPRGEGPLRAMVSCHTNNGLALIEHGELAHAARRFTPEQLERAHALLAFPPTAELAASGDDVFTALHAHAAEYGGVSARRAWGWITTTYEL